MVIIKASLLIHFMSFNDYIILCHSMIIFLDSSGDPVLTGLYSGPYFDLEQMKLPREFLKNGGDVLSGRTNVTTQVGSSAILPCVVKQVGSNTVRFFACS